ncbi:hypothetical protein SHIRM173S_06599 [Streptomyces hirsutus]
MEVTSGWTENHSKVAGVLIGSYSLSRFQVDATKAVTNSLAHGDSRGVVVGAGTGSGKTLAFYLPAFAAMANHRRTRVHTLALYPRIELLRDQLRDAIKNALELRGRGLPSPRIGVLYGRTPPSVDDVTQGTYEWAVQGGARVCPYLTCPTGDGGAMLWSEGDRARGSEALRCLVCNQEIPDGVMALTRESITVPPKLLFTTTEMLNPRVVLLDEVHTYSNTTGAQQPCCSGAGVTHAVVRSPSSGSAPPCVRPTASWRNLSGCLPGERHPYRAAQRGHGGGRPRVCAPRTARRPLVGYEPAVHDNPNGDAPRAPARQESACRDDPSRHQGIPLHRRPRRHQPPV